MERRVHGVEALHLRIGVTAWPIRLGLTSEIPRFAQAANASPLIPESENALWAPRLSRTLTGRSLRRLVKRLLIWGRIQSWLG